MPKVQQNRPIINFTQMAHVRPVLAELGLGTTSLSFLALSLLSTALAQQHTTFGLLLSPSNIVAISFVAPIPFLSLNHPPILV